MRLSGMWVYVAWWCVVVLGSASAANGDAFKEEVLVSDIDNVQGLATDNKNNLIYFSYRKDTKVFSAKVDMGTKAFQNITELYGQCEFTVDPVLGEVYAGCSADYLGRGAGIYKKGAGSGRFTLVGERNQNVRFVTYRSGTLYYSTCCNYLLQEFKDGKNTRVTKLKLPVHGLVFDEEGNWILHDTDKVYLWGGTNAEPTPYSGISGVHALAVDSRGNVYSCGTGTDRGIYRLDENPPGANRLVSTQCTALTFDDEDHITYADTERDNIVQLLMG